jgi:hypothetical protein
MEGAQKKRENFTLLEEGRRGFGNRIPKPGPQETRLVSQNDESG